MALDNRWLGDQGLEVEADEAELAARRAAKAAWMVARPLLPDPPPERWQQHQDGQRR